MNHSRYFGVLGSASPLRSRVVKATQNGGAGGACRLRGRAPLDAFGGAAISRVRYPIEQIEF